MKHICVNRLTIIGSDHGLSPGRRQAIIWTNTWISLIGPLGRNFSENLNEILTFSFRKMHLKMASAKWRPCCLGLNVLIPWGQNDSHIVDNIFKYIFLLSSKLSLLIKIPVVFLSYLTSTENASSLNFYCDSRDIFIHTPQLRITGLHNI